MTQQTHEGLALSVDERVDYLATVASIAAADVKLENTEKAKLREFCENLQLPEERVREVLDVAERPTASLEPRLERLKTSDLRFSLITDCLKLAFADGKYEKAEMEEIEKIAERLDVSGEQLEALTEAVRAESGAQKDEAGSSQVAAKLASVGVPLAAVTTASALGLTTAGATTGAAAIGLGLTAASGFGLALGAGVGTYMGVRWLAAKLK